MYFSNFVYLLGKLKVLKPLNEAQKKALPTIPTVIFPLALTMAVFRLVFLPLNPNPTPIQSIQTKPNPLLLPPSFHPFLILDSWFFYFFASSTSSLLIVSVIPSGENLEIRCSNSPLKSCNPLLISSSFCWSFVLVSQCSGKFVFGWVFL